MKDFTLGLNMQDIFSMAVETAQEGVTLITADGHIGYANAAWCRQVGRSIEDVKGRNITEFMTEEAVVGFHERHAARAAGQLRNQIEVAYKHGRTGETVHCLVNVSPLLDKNQNLIFSLAMHADITLLKKTQQQLGQAVGRLEKAESLARIGFWQKDIPTNESWWSSELYRMFGATESEVGGNILPFLGRVPPDDLEKLLALRKRAETEGIPFALKFRIIQPNGFSRTVNNIVEVENDKNGRTIKLLGSIQDITDQVEQENLIHEQRNQMLASAKLSALGEMAGGIAHEINTPLAIVKLTAEQALEDIEADIANRESLGKSVQTIVATVDRVAKIVRGLKTFSRNAEDDAFISTPLQTIIQDSFDLCFERFKSRGVHMETVGIDKKLELNCRPTQISQVIVNLLNNSFDAIESLTDRWIRIEVRDDQKSIEISVIDSGKGLNQKVQEKIFQPFFTTKEIGKGTGLGLSISRGLIKSHKGEIWLDSQSVNTRFTIRLPKDQTESQTLEVS